MSKGDDSESDAVVLPPDDAAADAKKTPDDDNNEDRSGGADDVKVAAVEPQASEKEPADDYKSLEADGESAGDGKPAETVDGDPAAPSSTEKSDDQEQTDVRL